MSIPIKIADKISNGIKRFQPVLQAAKARDVNESDTVIIVTDILAEVLGYDKYSEITSEYAIRGTYCDLAIKLEGHPKVLIEVKAIGIELKQAHIKQAVDYAANLGVEWVILTNGIQWKTFRVTFGQPIDQELVFEFDFMALDHKSNAHAEMLWLLTKDGFKKSGIDNYHAQRQAMSRYFLGAMVLSDPVLDVIRRELRRVTPGVKIEPEEIRNALTNEVIKREVLEGEKADEAKRKITRSQGRPLRAKQDDGDIEAPDADGSKAEGQPQVTNGTCKAEPAVATGQDGPGKQG